MTIVSCNSYSNKLNVKWFIVIITDNTDNINYKRMIFIIILFQKLTIYNAKFNIHHT